MAVIRRTGRDAKMLNWDKETRTLSAEASTIFGGCRNMEWERIYDDAADAGLVFYNRDTRNTVHFFIDEEKRDRDNDITEWILKPIPEDVRKIPRLDGVTLRIWND